MSNKKNIKYNRFCIDDVLAYVKKHRKKLKKSWKELKKSWKEYKKKRMNNLYG